MRVRKPYIDMIRAFSVCLIFLFHFFGAIPYMGCISLFGNFANGSWGNVGVFLFFMISGNCLITKYEKNFELKEFLKNRFLKIMIPFWICYIAVFLFNFWQTGIFPEVPVYKMILTVIGMDGFLAYRTTTFYLLGEWFLGSIIILYLLFPFTRWCIRKNIYITVSVLFVLNLILYHNNFWNFFQIDIGRNLLAALFYFSLGICLENWGYRKGRAVRICISLVSLICCVTVICFKLPINQYMGALLLSVSLYLVFMSAEVLMELPIFSAVVTVLSKNSYMVFLLHHVVIYKVAEHFAGHIYSAKGISCVLAICVLFIILGIFCYSQCMRLWEGAIRRYLQQKQAS